MKELKSFDTLFNYLSNKIQEVYHTDSWGDCNQINSTISAFLTEKGFANIEIVSGCINLDYPLDPEFDEPSNGVYDPRHMWIRFNSHILDFASDQFQDLIEDFTKKSYFYGECSSYNPVDTHPVNNEWTDQDLLKELLQDEELNKILKAI